MEKLTSVEGITVLAGLLANVLVILANKRKEDLTPQQNVIIGTLAAIAIFLVGIVLSPNAYPEGPNQAATVLFGAIIATLSAAGIPVYAEAAHNVRQQRRIVKAASDGQTPDNLVKARTWGVWSRQK